MSIMAIVQTAASKRPRPSERIAFSSDASMTRYSIRPGLVGTACTGLPNHPFREIETDHVDAKLGHAPGEVPVAAGHIQHHLVLTKVEQPILVGRDQLPVPAIAVAHPTVPELGVAVPDAADFALDPFKLVVVDLRSLPASSLNLVLPAAAILPYGRPSIAAPAWEGQRLPWLTPWVLRDSEVVIARRPAGRQQHFAPARTSISPAGGPTSPESRRSATPPPRQDLMANVGSLTVSGPQSFRRSNHEMRGHAEQRWLLLDSANQVEQLRSLRGIRHAPFEIGGNPVPVPAPRRDPVGRIPPRGPRPQAPRDGERNAVVK